MNEHNTYPVFVADQVLTAEHLNQVVNYLDEQGRLTRNRLSGIGIVCGLELRSGSGRIEISKGCGVTSEGYLLLQERKVCTYWRPYALPEYFSPEYKAVYEQWQMWELLSAEESLEAEDPRPLKGNVDFLADKIVVLLLEMKEKPLKNCVEIDCEDKGDKIEFRIKPLLVLKADMDAFIDRHEDASTEAGRLGMRGIGDLNGAGSIRRRIAEGRVLRETAAGRAGETAASWGTSSEDIQLRRFNVPARELKNTNEVFGAFLRIISESTLKQLAEALNDCYYRYQSVLNETANPFKHVSARFNDTLSHIKTANPFFIQYFYDWIDDIIKARNELESKMFDVQVACCPDRDLFPLHLMLGEAAADTHDYIKSAYRQYFIYSPLFNGQKELLAEVRLLFKRLVRLIEAFKVPDSRRLFTAEVKITPSKYLDKPLSERCIPYYYDPEAVYPVWSWDKARRGKAGSILSYHAGEYSSADTVLNPLNYDTEAYDFFRIEGHIGKPVTSALQSTLARRDEFNLPFDVVALSTASISAFFNSEDHNCHFRDLESIYRVLLAEMRCQFGEFECMAARIPYQVRTAAGDLTRLAATEGSSLRTNVSHVTGLREEAGMTGRPGTAVSGDTAASRGRLAAAARFRPGDFLRSHCSVQKGSVGEAYLDAVSKQVGFERISAFNMSAGLASISGAADTGNAASTACYASLFYFIHSVERMMEAVHDSDLDQLDITAFTARYEAVMDAAGDLARAGDALEALPAGNDNYQAILKQLRETGFYELAVRIHALLHVCLDDRLKALKAEYQRRIRELRLLTNLMHYAKKHPGMEHKAGVPKGGTFIMVYHESPSRRAGISSARVPVPEPAGEMETMVREAYISNPKLLRSFEKALDSFMNVCQDMDEDNRKRIRDILIRIPKEDEPLTFNVPEEAVIADFYLPYICCSDCAPVSYVLPETPRETLSISIKPTAFCNDDAKLYPVKVSPAGGELTASGGGISRENGFSFSPKGLKAGVNTLTYTLPDGRSTTIDLLVAEHVEVDFKTRHTGDLTVQFIPAFSGEGRQVIWDFGDGTTSDEFSPHHTYQPGEGEQNFVVTLRVTNAPCTAEASRTVTVRRPVDPEFDLKPRVFCVRDRKEYQFSIEPFPEKISEISNKDKLIINMDAAAKKLLFVPARHRITSTRNYRLEYKGIALDVRVVVPSAAFLMQIKWLDVDSLLILKPKQTEASNYTWTISQGRINRSFDSQVVEISMSELGLSVRTDFVISLRVNHQLPSGNCADEQRFVMTPALFRKYQGNGEAFENTTRE